MANRRSRPRSLSVYQEFTAMIVSLPGSNRRHHIRDLRGRRLLPQYHLPAQYSHLLAVYQFAMAQTVKAGSISISS